MSRAVIVAGDLVDGVWCPSCNAPVRIRIPLHLGDTSYPPAAHLEVCGSCGLAYMPARPVVEIVPARWHWPRLIIAAAWWWHRRRSARYGIPAVGCAKPGCPRPGWYECMWFETVDDGRIRWMFCSARHRRQWLARQSIEVSQG